ncbi:SANT/Myb-like DNA-binding domain-containing protein [Bradyrhizobium sp. WSM4349]|uniref:SANT/Myb-like DNA-binding domain-containing protein n=1 Tax=Bradyrhizobium sp. WSM4349 TaxID=1040988 RepID=UPI00039EC478|nr:SANT/Myb-like DNA-binding domain-containing protein [Bradyrhizobium sp. WSM4349]
MTVHRTCVRWSAAEDAALLRLRDIERRDWLSIAARLPGRSAASCEQRYYGKLKSSRDCTRRPRGPIPSRPAVSWRKRGGAIAVAPVVDAPAPPAPVSVRTRMPFLDHLRDRAELHLRIDRQGLTAAFFGDPPPGRSALDQRASAANAAVQRPSGIGVSDG